MEILIYVYEILHVFDIAAEVTHSTHFLDYSLLYFGIQWSGRNWHTHQFQHIAIGWYYAKIDSFDEILMKQLLFQEWLIWMDSHSYFILIHLCSVQSNILKFLQNKFGSNFANSSIWSTSRILQFLEFLFEREKFYNFSRMSFLALVELLIDAILLILRFS